jgi:hypothetical protein
MFRSGHEGIRRKTNAPRGLRRTGSSVCRWRQGENFRRLRRRPACGGPWNEDCRHPVHEGHHRVWRSQGREASSRFRIGEAVRQGMRLSPGRTREIRELRQLPGQVPCGRLPRAISAAKDAVKSRANDIVVLDEALYAVKFGLVTTGELLGVLAARHPDVHVILTGNARIASLEKVADTVTRMMELKHHLARGVRSVRGIDR